MKQFIIIVTFLLGLCAAAQDKPYFQLPIIPDSLSTLQQRTDYMVQHYWDFCDLKKAFSARDKMAESFHTYLTFMPYASADVVYASVDKFMAKIAKQPADVLFIGEQAESMLYSDTAEFQSDELYLRFAQAIADNKKVDKNAKLRYQHQAKILSQSQIGMIAPEFDFPDIMGVTQHFVPDTTCVATILYFNDPDCSDCNMAKLRLDADIKTNRLIESGRVKVVSITPGGVTDEWQLKASSYPASWRIGASEDVDDIYDIRHTPSFYIIDNNGKIVLKNGDIDIVLRVMSLLNAPRARKSETNAAANE